TGVAADLLPALAEAVARSVGAAHARVTLPGSGASAAWPDEADRRLNEAGRRPDKADRRTDEADRTPDVGLDVRDGAELLGRIAVLLGRHGIAPALRSHVDRLGRPGLLDVSPAVADRRFDARAENAAYFCGVALVAQLDAVRLAVTEDDGALVVEAVGGAAEPD